jgi:hypothetical protein
MCWQSWCNLGAIPTKTTKNRVFKGVAKFFVGTSVGTFQYIKK